MKPKSDFTGEARLEIKGFVTEMQQFEGDSEETGADFEFRQVAESYETLTRVDGIGQ